MSRTATKGPKEYALKRAAVLKAIASGQSVREASAAHGVPKSTVDRWAKAEREEEDVAPVAALPPAVVGAVTSTLDVLRATQAEFLVVSAKAKEVGNMTAAQRALKSVADLSTVIARVERTTKDDADVLTISRADIEVAVRAQRDRMRAVLSRPLCCAKCGREMAIKWGHSAPEE
jgi:transposase-like protein